MGFFDWHKRQTEWWKKKLNISDYGADKQSGKNELECGGY